LEERATAVRPKAKFSNTIRSCEETEWKEEEVLLLEVKSWIIGYCPVLSGVTPDRNH